MNRVIKDSIWSSRSLAKLSLGAQLHWPRWLLMADDWGCFNADTEVIKGLVYPKLKTITPGIIENLKDAYFNSGKLFLWSEGDREYGYFTSWSNHQFCNATHLDEEGKQNRHKRKTPEPPEKLLQEFLDLFKKENPPLTEDLERVRTLADKYRIPIPNPIPNPKEKGDPVKLSLGEHKNVKLTQEEHKKLQALVMPNQLGMYIENLSDYIASKGKQYKSHYATLRAWLRKDGLLKALPTKRPPIARKTEAKLTDKEHENGKEALKKIRQMTSGLGNLPKKGK